MFDISLTCDQKNALDSIFSWYKNPNRQYVTLGGYAGTGKTTLIGRLREKIFKDLPVGGKKKKVAFCSFTGKASQVLDQNLKFQKVLQKDDRVSTIHSLIYKAIDDDKGRVIGWKKRDKVEFDLIIVDEASMVSAEIWKDLLSFKVPIIAVGDHGQLPPIGGKFNLMETPLFKLSQIHRQVVNSPIIKLSIMARESGYIPEGKYSSEVFKYKKDNFEIHSILEDLISNWNEETMFLVGFNHSRVKLNQEIRMARGLEETNPLRNDRVICLKNNWQKGIYNGMMGTIMNITNEYDEGGNLYWYLADIAMEDGIDFMDKICVNQFNNNETVREVEGLHWSKIGDLFDFGYALTVHKAQGSQSQKVVIFEERNKHMTDEDWRRWLYTAVTRAQEELVVIGG